MEPNTTPPALNITGGASSEGSSEWGWMVKAVSCQLIVVVGLVANLLTLIVMKSPRLRYKSYSHYLSALAVFDSVVLIGEEIDIADQLLVFQLNRPSLFVDFSDGACKVYKYLETTSTLMSSWLIVAMAIERLCVVSMPFRRNIWCQQKGAVLIIMALFTAIASTQLFRIFMIESNGKRCISSIEYESVFMALHVYFYLFALHFLAPVIIVLVCNVGVLWKVFSVEKATQCEESSSTRLTGNNSHRRSKTTRMLMAVSLTYIITTLPLHLLTMTIHILAKTYGKAARIHMIRAMPWFQVLQAFKDINYASNFFIYILSGKKFRIELRHIFSRARRTSSFVRGSSRSRTRDEILML